MRRGPRKGHYVSVADRNLPSSFTDPANIGLRFGKLVVLAIGAQEKKGKTWWTVKCDCGVVRDMVAQPIKYLKHLTCGCGKWNWTFPDERVRAYHRYKCSAKTRKIFFDLPPEVYEKLVVGNCFYCGAPPDQTADGSRKKFIGSGIDRKNNAEGYTVENCVSCCITCNYGKHTQTAESFIAYLKRAGEYQNAKT
jgi:hypothetical protein